MTRSYVSYLVILLVLLIDVILKIYIKTNVEYGTGFGILGLDWARIHFVENEGMAFGLSFGGITGKYILSIFRIFMVGFLGYLLYTMIKTKESFGLIISFSLIIAGAIGNIIDSALFGLIFTESYFHSGLAEMVPFGEGYAPFLQGKVVDMLYFPMVDTTWPDWVPKFGGQRFEFFRPVFNIADSSISLGVTLILIFYRSIFIGEPKKKVINSVS